jgi:hypothetical protein
MTLSAGVRLLDARDVKDRSEYFAEPEVVVGGIRDWHRPHVLRIWNHRRKRQVAITFELNCAAPGSLRRRFPIVRTTLSLFRDHPSRYERDTRTCRPIIWSRLIAALGLREWPHTSA